MNLDAILFGLGSSTVFTARAFVPAFLSALLLRYGHSIPLLSRIDLLEKTGHAPVWFTHPLTIAVLGALAVLEIVATKVPEAQVALEDVHKYLKTGTAALCYLGVVSATDQAFIGKTVQHAGLFDSSIALVVAVSVYYTSSLRARLLEFLVDADEDDDLGLRHLLSWFEDAWSALGVILLLVYPIVMMVLLGLAMGLMWAIGKYLEHREDQSRTPCRSCGTPIYPCATACPKCRTAVESPRAVGLFGQSKAAVATEPADHPQRLTEKRRCPVCATRLKARGAPLACPECGHQVLREQALADAYVARIDRRLPLVLVVTAALSLVPVLGLLPGIIYYRFVLVSPFRRYLPLGKRFLLKWLVRLLFLVLIVLQVFPVVGGLAVPLMALTSYGVYRAAFVRMLRSAPAA